MDPVVSVYTAADFENQIRGVKFHSRYFFGGNWVFLIIQIAKRFDSLNDTSSL